MIDAQTASAGQYSAGNQQGFNLMRQSAQDALTGNQQYAQSQLAMAQQAQQMAIAQAKERERKAIEDQILAYVLKGGRA
jgi:pectate lyase